MISQPCEEKCHDEQNQSRGHWGWNHRHHHRYSDEPEDVHSPFFPNFFWSHMGWVLTLYERDIKKAYRRLMNRNHPDKIAGSNPDAEAVALAEQRTREVRGAYEMLKARRSIR